jgi:hypothetical protein
LYSLVAPCIPLSAYSSFCSGSESPYPYSYGGYTGTTTSKYVCCSTDNCNNQAFYTTDYGNPPTYSTVTLSITLRVNLAFVSDYTNLNSAASLTFIQNLKTFVNIYIIILIIFIYNYLIK